MAEATPTREKRRRRHDEPLAQALADEWAALAEAVRDECAGRGLAAAVARVEAAQVLAADGHHLTAWRQLTALVVELVEG